MQWRDIRRLSKAIKWDLLIAKTQTLLIATPDTITDLKYEILSCLERLPKNMGQVQAKADDIKWLLNNDNWHAITVEQLELSRLSLRDIMWLLEGEIAEPIITKETDIVEIQSEIKTQYRSANIESIDYHIYLQKVQESLVPLFDSHPLLKKIRQGQDVSEAELIQLNSIIHTTHGEIDIETLKTFYPDTTLPLDKLLRAIVGMDNQYIEDQFNQLLQQHRMSAQTQRFIDMLINLIAKSGGIKMADLDQAPYNRIYEGVLGDSEDDVFSILKQLELPTPLTAGVEQ